MFGERVREGRGSYGEGSVAPRSGAWSCMVEAGGLHLRCGGFERECSGVAGQ